MAFNGRVTEQPAIRLIEPLPVRDDVTLRRWRGDDAPGIAEACSYPEIAKWIPVPSPYPVEEARRYVQLTEHWWRSGENFVLCIAEDDEVIGSISLRMDRDRPSIGYWLAKSVRGRGIMTRAVEVFSKWSSETFGLREVWIFVQPANSTSRAVAQRAGFVEHHERVTWPDAKERMLYRLPLGTD